MHLEFQLLDIAAALNHQHAYWFILLVPFEEYQQPNERHCFMKECGSVEQEEC